MAETTPSIGKANLTNPEPARQPGRISRRGFLGGVAAGIGLAMTGVSTAVAETPTNTPTSTPDPFSAEKTAVAGAQATVAVVKTREALVEEKANAIATAEKAQENINAKLGTPTKTPTPNPTDVAAASATARASVVADRATRVAAVDAVSTAEAKPTLTNAQREQTRVAVLKTQVTDEEAAAQARKEAAELGKRINAAQGTPTGNNTPNNNKGGFPVTEVAIGVAGLGILGAGVRWRKAIGNTIPVLKSIPGVGKFFGS